MEKMPLKIDETQIARMVARELRDEPISYFINDDKSSLTVNFSNEKNMLGTFLILYKNVIDPIAYAKALSKLNALS